MLFQNHGNGNRYSMLGFTPQGLPAGSPAASSGGSAGVIEAGVNTPTANDVCTSDGHLIYINGAWRLRSDPNQSCASTIPSEDTSYIYNSGQRIYAGPFPIDLKNRDGQISFIDNPTQIGSDWGAWLAQALAGKANALAQAGAHSPLVDHRVQIFSLLPRVVGATQDYYDNGTPQGAPVMQTAIADVVTGHSIPTSFPPIAPELASGGHPLHPSHAWFDNDAHGFRITRVMYEGDPNTYSYYNRAQWLQALSPDLLINGLGWLLFGPVPLPSNMEVHLGQFDSIQPGFVPLARFKFACNTCTDTSDWGVWAGTTLPDSADRLVKTEGVWSTAIDGPQHFQFQVGLMPLPQTSDWIAFWNAVIGAIAWLPMEIGSIVFDIGQWLAEVACDLSKMQASLATIKDPATKAEAIAAFTLASAACPAPPPPPDCAIFPNTPGCIKTMPAVRPWWKQWYVIIPALGLLGFGIFKILGNKPRSQPAT